MTEPDAIVAMTRQSGLDHFSAGRFQEAKIAFHAVATAHPDSPDGFLLLAAAQAVSGEHEKVLVNLDAASKALARIIAEQLRERNSIDSEIIKTPRLGAGRWMDVAMLGAIQLCAADGIRSVAFPTGASAEREEERETHRGLYFADHRRWLFGRRRVFLPNFFATFCAMLLSDPAETYFAMCATRAGALRALGRAEEAEIFETEAAAFDATQV